jgi:sigma-B regulation protein RsbU (phosphoserine phosphatase)
MSEGVLTYTIAGHNPPLVIRNQAKEVIELDKGGIALGALPDIHLEDRQLKLEPADCLLLYTDGVTEAFDNHDQMYGTDRLISLLNESFGHSAHQVLAILDEDLRTFRDSGPLSDDTTILAICRESLLADQDRDAGLAQDTIDGTAE